MLTTGKEQGAFSLFSKEDIKKRFPTMAEDELSKNAKGGTEYMKRELMKRLNPKLRDQFQFIPTRVRQIDPTRPSILWLHDVARDPEVQHLRDSKSRDRFAKLVFVSNWQLQNFVDHLGVPYSKAIVLKNTIDPIDVTEADKKLKDGVVRLIYHTTPHRGLELLVPVFARLYKEFTNKIHLDVFSSFEVYGWPERDKQYEPIFQFCRDHPGITYHGAQDNLVVREALKSAHIFAYPSIWPETSCIAAIEAMSAGCHVVCPNYAALPETCANFAHMYQWDEDMNRHAGAFASQLHTTIKYVQNDGGLCERQQLQKMYFDIHYNWDIRIAEWESFLRDLCVFD